MKYRELGRTGWKFSQISFGAWAIGGAWGTVDDRESLNALHKAVDRGVNFFDTADVYGDGRSERLLGQLRRHRQEEIFIATKAGRRLDPHVSSGYNTENLNAFVDRSLENLRVDAIDLLQLHSAPTEVYYRPDVFEALEQMVQKGKIRYYGVSVEKVEEALKAIEYPNLQSVQIIFNIFRQRPRDLLFGEARRRGVGILARLPLSSGMLTGKLNAHSQFEADDHRSFNRHGEAFDRGETFSGVDYEIGLKSVEDLRRLVPKNMTLAQFALRWILMFEEVTCAIPGARRVAQVEENVLAAELQPLPDSTMEEVQKLYDATIRPLVHHYW
jgi:aryl-alcohol dehydrogenase-like predicted oxidoreductase